MGWLFRPITSPVDLDAEFRRIFTSSDPDRVTYEILKRSSRGNTHYLAVRIMPEDHVVAFVILTKTYTENGRRYHGYKDMDETMLPYYFDAPASLIRLLTPTTNENANEWRRRCLDKPKVVKLTKFRLPEPLSFGSFQAQEFEKVDLPRKRSVYRTLDTTSAHLVRLQARHIEGATPL